MSILVQDQVGVEMLCIPVVIQDQQPQSSVRDRFLIRCIKVVAIDHDKSSGCVKRDAQQALYVFTRSGTAAVQTYSDLFVA